MAAFPGHEDYTNDDAELSAKDNDFLVGGLSLNGNMSQSVTLSSSHIFGSRGTADRSATSNPIWRNFRQRLPYYVPIMSWLPKYQKSFLPGDFAAGLSLAVVMVPQSIAYSSLVHVPANMGLYTAFYTPIIYAILGSSPQLSVGPETATAIIIGSMAASLASPGPDGHATEEEVIRLITQFTFVCGILTLVMGVLRLGFIDSILSAPVLAGFIQAEALILIVEQAPRLIGIEHCPASKCEDSGGYIPKALWFFEHMGDVHWQTVLVSVCCIATLGIFGYCKVKWSHVRRLVIFPHVALVVLVATIMSWALDMESSGVEVIGKVTAGLVAPSFHVPSGKDLSTMLPLSVTVMVIGFVASQVASKRFAQKYGYTQSANRDLVAFGMASLVGSCFGSWPGYGSLMRTKVSDAAGGRTAMAGLFASLLVLMVILFVTPAFYHMPKAVTASIIFSVAISLLDLAEFRFIIKCKQWRDAALLLSMMIITFCFGITTGVFFAFGACLLLVVRLTTSPGVTMLGRSSQNDEFLDLGDVTVKAESIEGLLIYKIEGPLHFANAAKLRDSTRRVEYYGALHVHPSAPMAPVQLSCAVFDMTSLTQVDSSAAAVLLDIVRHYHERDVRICFVHLRPEIHQLFERAGIIAELERTGARSLFATLREAVVTLQEHIEQQQTLNKASPSTSLTNQPSSSSSSTASGAATVVDGASESSVRSTRSPSTSTGTKTAIGGTDPTPLLDQSSPTDHRERKLFSSISSASPRHQRHSSRMNIDITKSPSVTSIVTTGGVPVMVDTGSPIPGGHIRRLSLRDHGDVSISPLTRSGSGNAMTVRFKPSTSFRSHSRFMDESEIPVLQQSPLVLIQALGREPSSVSNTLSPLRQQQSHEQLSHDDIAHQ